jgi:cytochrome P450 PksS
MTNSQSLLSIFQPSRRLNLAAPHVRQNPYPVYAELRRTDPIALVHMPFFGKTYFISRYADVLDALKDPRISNDVTGSTATKNFSTWMPKSVGVLGEQMLSKDDPEHRRLRDLVHKAFTPKRIQAMADRVTAITDELLNKADQQNQVDLIADFALPIPLVIISEMLDVPERDRMYFHQLTATFLESTSSGLLHAVRSYGKLRKIIRYFEDLIADRRQRPGDDLISALIAAEEAGDRLSQDELVGMLFLLLLAGHETTVNLIGSGALALLEHPTELAALRADATLWDSALEELLRFTNPVELSSPRHAKETFTWRGVTIPAGHRMLVGIGSANRDETVFPDPDRLDIRRSPNKHLAFGFGPHYCLGAPLARMEGRIALQTLIERFPQLTLAVPPAALVWRSSTLVRGLKSLPVYMHGQP